MKKLLFIFMAVALVGTAKAQSEFSIGPKVGFNITNISHADGSKNKPSIFFGGFAQYKFNDKWAIQPELLYSRQGYRVKEDGDKAKLRMNYLNLPILAKYYIADGFSVEAGPQLGFLLNGKVKSDIDGVETKVKFKEGNGVDLSLAVGLGYEFNNGLLLSARYNFGLTNAIDKDFVDTANKNHVFQVSVGWKFGL